MKDASIQRCSAAEEGSYEQLLPEFMISAYLQGCFPMMVPLKESASSQQDSYVLRWFRPDPRAILRFQDFHLSRSLRRVIRKGDFEIRWNHSFREVMRGCAEREDTWLTLPLQRAYERLFKLGWVESVAAFRQQELVGGIYGVSIRGVFFAESMFCRQSNMSKVALWALIEGLKMRQQSFIDCQFLTPHLQSLGAVEISDATFQKLLWQRCRGAIKSPPAEILE